MTTARHNFFLALESSQDEDLSKKVCSDIMQQHELTVGLMDQQVSLYDYIVPLPPL